MSISVTGYTEAKIEGKWYCIDFFQYDMNGHVHHIPCVEGQSIVHTALQWECDMDRIGVPTDLSPQVKAECTGRDGKLFGEDDPHWNPWHMVRGSWFGSVDLDQPEHCGYFPRQAVADYLSNPHDVTLDEGDMIPVEEYRELPEEEKKAYQYYEYTSPYGNRSIRAIYGMTGAESIPILEKAAAALGDDIAPDYVYDPAEHEGVAFEDLPEDWKCPRCKQGKEKFNKA